MAIYLLTPATACPPFDSRQLASAFNQPLSWDTSSVTHMGWMFAVRSFPLPSPILACTHRMPPFRLSAVRVGVQCGPLGLLRRRGGLLGNLQRHKHALHVLRALLSPRVLSDPSAVAPCPCARCVHCVVTRCLLPPGSHLSHRMPLYAPFDSRQYARAFNKPLSFTTTSRVTSMRSMFDVRSARACSLTHICSRVLPCMLRPCAAWLPAASRLPARIWHRRHRIPPLRLSAGSVGVQSAAATTELGHLQRERHVRHVHRALRPCPYPYLHSRALYPAPCAYHDRLPPPASRMQPAPLTACHSMPPFRLSAARVGVQSAAEL